MAFDGHRQKFAVIGIFLAEVLKRDEEIGIHFAEIGKPDGKIGNEIVNITQKFAVIGKILPQPASFWRRSSKGMMKSASIWPASAKICLNRHSFCGNRQTGWENRQRNSGHYPKICHHRQNFASIGICLAEILKRDDEIGIRLAGIGKNFPQSAFILRKSANRMRE